MSKVQQSYQWGRMEWLAGSEVANAENLSVARMQMLPGGEGERHRHPNCEEAIVVIRGSVEIRIGEKSFRRSAGECVVVPAGSVHSVTNVGNDEVELILTYSAGDRVYEPC